MLVAITHPESLWEACQASFLIHRAHKRMNRTVIQALIRERLELAVEQASDFWKKPEDFEAGRAFVQDWMIEQLALNDLELSRLELVGLPRNPPLTVRQDLVPHYQEVWLDGIKTSDGFELNLAVAVRWWVLSSFPLCVEMIVSLGDRFRHSAEEFFKPLDCETGLAQMANWQASLQPQLEWWSDTYRELVRLWRAHQGVAHQRDLAIRADATWVTRKEVRASSEAFQPGKRYGYLDPYQLFFMLKDPKLMSRHYRSGKG